MNNCPSCGHKLDSPLAKAMYVFDFYNKLSRQHQTDFMAFHSISFPIVYTISRKFVDADTLTPNGIEWVENLYREVLGYEEKPERQTRFKKAYPS